MGPTDRRLKSPKTEGVTRSFVNRLLRLTLLAPDIVEAILEGRQPKGMQLEELTRTRPSGWEEQHESVAIGQSHKDTEATPGMIGCSTSSLGRYGRAE
jgi:hypothetical protein